MNEAIYHCWETLNSSSVSGHITVCAQSCLTLCDPMDCNLPGSSVHGISQARILECVATSHSRGSSQPRDLTCISSNPHLLHLLHRQVDSLPLASPGKPKSHHSINVWSMNEDTDHCWETKFLSYFRTHHYIPLKLKVFVFFKFPLCKLKKKFF